MRGTCQWCKKPTHTGQCREWWDAHPEKWIDWYKKNQAAGAKRKREAERYPIRETPEWKAAAKEAREGLMQAWDNKEEIAPWVMKLANLMSQR